MRYKSRAGLRLSGRLAWAEVIRVIKFNVLVIMVIMIINKRPRFGDAGWRLSFKRWWWH